MKNLIALIGAAVILGGCTGSREMYNKNGLTLVQVGADPTPLNGGYNVLIAEVGDTSTILSVDSTGTVIEQIALPAGMIGGAAALRPDRVEIQGDTIVSPTKIRSGGVIRKD